MSMTIQQMTVSTEAGEVAVTSKEQAVRMIIATAKQQTFKTQEDLESSTPIVELANKFGINLSHFKRLVSPNLGEHHLGFGPYELEYTEGVNGFNYSPTIVLLQVPEYAQEEEDYGDNMIIATEKLKECIPALDGATIVSLPEDANNVVALSTLASASNDSELILVLADDADYASFLETIIKEDLIPNYHSASLITMYFEEQIESLEIQVNKTQHFNNTDFTNEVEKLGRYLSIELD